MTVNNLYYLPSPFMKLCCRVRGMGAGCHKISPVVPFNSLAHPTPRVYMTRIFPPFIAIALLAMLSLPSVSPAQPPVAKPEEELVDKVRKTIERGVKALEKQQTKAGNWEGPAFNLLADMDGGVTSLVTLALLNCGVKAEEQSVSRALQYLRTVPPKKTYVVGLQNMVFAEARQARDAPQIQKNIDWIIATGIGWKVDAQGRVTGGKLRGWSYPGNDIADNSNTQYALLGLYSGKQAGARVDDSVWNAIREFFTRTQTKSGASGYWKYYVGSDLDTEPSFTMTVAGVCGLIIAGMGLDLSEQNLNPETGVAANCGAYSENAAVARGMNWVGGKLNYDQSKWIFYNIYGVERLGRLSGQRFIGRYDWYREGCEYLVRIQDQDGTITRGKGFDSSPTIATAFALLFLSKGRTPVLVSKLAWGNFQDREDNFVELPNGGDGIVNWNRKHSDTRHMVEFASRELFKGVPLSWQVYDVRRRTNLTSKDEILAEVGILLQSPVLYINGHGKLIVTDVQKEILKTYIEEGGFIFGEACCGDPIFAESFRTLMKELFPATPLRRLPPEHAVWTAHFKDVRPAQFPDLEGMEKGCRTVMVFSPNPLAGYWEERRFMGEAGKPATNKGVQSFHLAGNVIAYATGMELPKPKLTRRDLQAGGKELNPPRGAFQAAQLRTPGEAEAAPAAMRNLMLHLRNNVRLEVALDKQTLDAGDDNLFKYKFMYLHGRKPLDFTDLQIETVRSNLQTGGLLFADAGCNGVTRWKEFDASFRATVKKLFPDSELTVIPPLDDFYSEKVNGKDRSLTSIRCRRESADGAAAEAEFRPYAPYLEGIKIDGRWAVIYSKYDVGCALEGHKSSDCLGHDRESALKIGSAVVLYALKR